jgi:hypothetical protein
MYLFGISSSSNAKSGFSRARHGCQPRYCCAGSYHCSLSKHRSRGRGVLTLAVDRAGSRHGGRRALWRPSLAVVFFPPSITSVAGLAQARRTKPAHSLLLRGDRAVRRAVDVSQRKPAFARPRPHGAQAICVRWQRWESCHLFGIFSSRFSEPFLSSLGAIPLLPRSLPSPPTEWHGRFSSYQIGGAVRLSFGLAAVNTSRPVRRPHTLGPPVSALTNTLQYINDCAHSVRSWTREHRRLLALVRHISPNSCHRSFSRRRTQP